MRPIDPKTDFAFAQALRCVEYRLPLSEGLRSGPFHATVALRYGLIGCAAVYQILLDQEANSGVIAWDRAISYPAAVERHLVWDLEPRLKARGIHLSTEVIREGVECCLHHFLGCYERRMSLTSALKSTAEHFLDQNLTLVWAGSSFLARASMRRRFQHLSEVSVRFASNFYQRRIHHLEEVPEIALLGE